jgi:hypothetical protein
MCAGPTHTPAPGSGFFVDAKHRSVLRWAEVETQSIVDFFLQEWVRGKLEICLAVWLETKSLPDPMNCGVR